MGCCNSSTAIPLAPCFICDLVDTQQFQCAAGHAMCEDCFTNQVNAWADLTTGGCNDINALLKQVAPHVKNHNMTHIDKALDFVGALQCCHPGCATLTVAADVLPFLGESREPYKVACRHQTSKLQQRRLALTGAADAEALALVARTRSEREIYMEEQLLTLRCPWCRLAVADFDGCFAVQCSGCATWFCAWCLSFHGSCADAHAHVAVCEENPLPDKSVWSTIANFQKHHDQRRLALCLKFLTAQHDASLNTRARPILATALGEANWKTIHRQLPRIAQRKRNVKKPVFRP